MALVLTLVGDVEGGASWGMSSVWASTEVFARLIEPESGDRVVLSQLVLGVLLLLPYPESTVR